MKCRTMDTQTVTTLSSKITKILGSNHMFYFVHIFIITVVASSSSYFFLSFCEFRIDYLEKKVNGR